MKYQQLFKDADRQQAYADALMAKSAKSRAPIQRGRITPKMNWGSGAAQLGEALLARHAGKSAGKKRTAAEEAKAQAMAEALTGMSGTQDNPYASAQGAIDSGVHPAVAGEYMKNQQPQAPKPTDDQREYEFARGQGYKGSLMDWITDQRKAGASTTTIRNEGTIPAGYEVERDAQGNPLRMVPITGSPAALEIEANTRQQQQKGDVESRKTDVVLDEIDRIFATMDAPSLPETGIAGQVLKNVPGTDAHSVMNNLKTITANIGFDRLQQMRESSPTGGALGNVTIGELERLEAVKGSLAQSQLDEDLQYNLARLNNEYLDIIHGKDNGPERMTLPELSARAEKKPSDLAVGTVDGEYIFTGGDPSDKNNWKHQ